MRAYLTKAVDTIARAFGVATVVERASSRSFGVRVMPDQALWYQFQRIGGAMTPARVTQILRQRDSGDMTAYVDLLNESRQKDGHLHGNLSQAEESIVELDWTLKLPEKARARDKRAMRWLDNALRQCTGDNDSEAGGFADLIAHLAGAFYVGHQVAEPAFRKDRDGYIAPKGFYALNARRFGYRSDDGVFVWKDETTGYRGVDLRKEYPGRFIIFQPRVNGDVPVREGLGSVLMWAALFRNWSVTDWLRTAELTWKPWRIGTYKKGASDQDIEALKTAMDTLVTTGSAVLPETTDFQAEWAAGSGGSGSRPTHAELFNVIAMEMSKAVLGATETVQSSSSSGFAQAKVHHGVTKTILRGRARQVAACITRDLVATLIRINFGKDVAIPQFEFILPDPVDIQAFGAGVKSLTDAGCNLSQNWVRNRVGAVAPENDDDEMGVESPEPETPEPDDESDPTGDDSGQPPPGSGEGDGEPAVEPADVTPD